MKRALILIVVLLIVASGVAFTLIPRGSVVQTVPVERGEIREFVDERGKTRLPETYVLTMPYAGRVEAITLREGDPVSAGQTVVRLVPADLDNDVAEAAANVERLAASIHESSDISLEQRVKQQSELFVQSMAATVAAADARRTTGKEQWKYSERALERIQRLAETGAKSEDELEQAQLSVIEDRIGYQQDELVFKAVSAIDAATGLLPAMVDDYITRKGLSTAVLEKQRAEAQVRLDQARLRRQRGTMKSPVDGVVLERAIDNEQYAAAGTTLLRIGRLEELEVEADVLSLDVVKIHVGDQAEIYGPAVDALPGKGFFGLVHRIYPSGFTKISSLGVEQQRVKVVVRLEPGQVESLRRRGLGAEFRVRVRIYSRSKSNALIVPRSALFRAVDGQWQVFVAQSGRAVLQTVEAGLMNEEQAEVVQGLEEGDRVIVAPDSGLLPGARVRPRDEDEVAEYAAGL